MLGSALAAWLMPLRGLRIGKLRLVREVPGAAARALNAAAVFRSPARSLADSVGDDRQPVLSRHRGDVRQRPVEHVQQGVVLPEADAEGDEQDGRGTRTAASAARRGGRRCSAGPRARSAAGPSARALPQPVRRGRSERRRRRPTRARASPGQAPAGRARGRSSGGLAEVNAGRSSASSAAELPVIESLNSRIP